MEPDPDFLFDPYTRPCRTDVTAYRQESYRLEPERVAGKLVAHNYGGAAIPLTCGHAEAARDIAAVARHGTSAGVAAIGTGVMGPILAMRLATVTPRMLCHK